MRTYWEMMKNAGIMWLYFHANARKLLLSPWLQWPHLSLAPLIPSWLEDLHGWDLDDPWWTLILMSWKNTTRKTPGHRSPALKNSSNETLPGFLCWKTMTASIRSSHCLHRLRGGKWKQPVCLAHSSLHSPANGKYEEYFFRQIPPTNLDFSFMWLKQCHKLLPPIFLGMVSTSHL